MKHLPSTIQFKIGAVSELTGIPVTTIRDWENRYQAFTPTKTSGKHRMYKQSDIERAQLFKQLSEMGQSISTVANLSNTELEGLLSNYLQAQQSNKSNTNNHHPRVGRLNPEAVLEAWGQANSTPTKIVRVTVIGSALAKRLEGAKFTQAFTRAKLHINKVFNDLSAARSEINSDKVNKIEHTLTDPHQLWVISQNTLQQESADEICSLTAYKSSEQIILLYQFAPSAVVESLRKKGFVLKREPLTERDLAELISSVIVVDPEESISSSLASQNATALSAPSLALIPPRKYSDESLLKVAAISTNIMCECPKHVSEIISQLASFEKYSQDCLSQSRDDKELHGYLSSVSGTARALFEIALEKLAAHEGIVLEP